MQDAEDIVQELFVKIYTKKEVQIKNEKAFFFTLTKNMSIDKKRKDKAKGGVSALIDEAMEGENENNIFVKILNNNVINLEGFELIKMIYDGFKTREIADKLDISHRKANYQIEKEKRALCHMIEKIAKKKVKCQAITSRQN